MLDIKFVRENPKLIEKDLKKRGDKEKVSWLKDLLQIDKKARKLKQEIDSLRRERNNLAEKIKALRAKNENTSLLIQRAKALPKKIKLKERKLSKLNSKIRNYLMNLPNPLHEDVPIGKDENDNVVVRKWGEPIKKEFELMPHGEFLEHYGFADFSRAAKVAGRGFYYLLRDVALLDLALQRFAIDFLIDRGFALVLPPFVLRRKAYEGVVSLEDFENVMYKIEDEDLYLIATSEHAIGAMFMDEIIEEDKLPLKFVGLSACFRKEIGSHGVDTKGLFRVHQFNKVEQFVFAKPEESWQIHEELISNAEQIFQALKLPYRIVNICTGDIGSIAAKKYDLEVWMPREQRYREAVSCSNCTAYQATRLNIKLRRKDGSKEYLHTLNSTAIATSRAIRAIVENFQEKDGTIKIPKVLHKYMNGQKEIIIKRN